MNRDIRLVSLAQLFHFLMHQNGNVHSESGLQTIYFSALHSMVGFSVATKCFCIPAPVLCSQIFHAILPRTLRWFRWWHIWLNRLQCSTHIVHTHTNCECRLPADYAGAD